MNACSWAVVRALRLHDVLVGAKNKKDIEYPKNNLYT